MIVVVMALLSCEDSLISARRTTECPRLDSRLAGLVNASDRVRFAATASLDLSDSGVRVLVVVDSQRSLPPSLAREMEASYADEILARVPPDELCNLARQPGIRAVKPASREFLLQTGT